MLEILLMGSSLVVLSYGFYMSARMFWVYRSEKNLFRPLYFIAMSLIISTLFFFAMVLFSFVLSGVLFSQVTQILNNITGVFWLAGAGLVTAIMKYHIDIVSSVSRKNVDTGFKGLKRIKGFSGKSHFNRIKGLKSEMEETKDMGRFEIGRDLKIIELNNKIDEYERSFKNRIKK